MCSYRTFFVFGSMLDTKKRGIAVVRSTCRGSCIAYCCWTDNVRAHADMNIVPQSLTDWHASCSILAKGMRINTSRGRLPLLSSRQQSIGCKISTRLKQSVVNAFLCHSPLPTSGGIALRLFRCSPPRSTPSEDFASLSTAWAVLFSNSRLKRQSSNRECGKSLQR